jgi:TonB family protein
MATELLLALWEGLLASSAGCLLVLLLRRPWARLFGASTTPLLWGLVPLCLLAVWLPAPSLAVQEGWGVLPAIEVAAPATPEAAVTTTSRFDLALLLAPWAAGSALAALYFVLLQRLLAERTDVGPAVLGALRPRIVLPADFHTRYSPDEQALILAHERSHQRRGDVLANAIATGLRAVYWFNPLLHYAANRLRHDHELASDAEVVQRYPHARRRYADTLLNVQLAVPGLPVGCLWQSSHPLKERLLMLSTSRSTPRRRTLGTALALGLSLSAAALAWASQPPRLNADHPVWTQQAVSLKAESRTLRQAVESVAREAGVAISGVEMLDRIAPAADIELDINATPAGMVLESLLDARPVQYAFAGDVLLLSAAEPAATPAEAPAQAPSEQGPTYRRLSAPSYPASAIRKQQTGYVLLHVMVGIDGTPSDIAVSRSSGTTALDNSAIAAVKDWQFNPATRNGEPVAVRAQVPVCFQLSQRAINETTCPTFPDALDGIYRIPPEVKPNG